ncbi:ANTAR domain-containing protein [Mycolicibacterium hodleri]|uniref:ANTAR domain-containing protein n=1 Tax=Mycolicibacterium hodleri TaxID=49897 RepID=UPI000A6A64BC|nr:ANTAR domain-containing protein [Mycolicibacterium hodleri]
MTTQDETLSDETLAAERDQMWAASREFNERRATTEQAKGMLMFVYGIDADQAFDVLRSQSQENNVKLSLLAEQVVKDLVELARANEPGRRPGIDRVIVAARSRITNVAARQLNGESKTGVQMKDL